MRRWVLAIAGLIAAAAVAVFGIGFMLPVSHTASLRAVVPATPEEVWAVVTDVGGFPTWRPDVDSVELLPVNGRPGWRESGPEGSLTFEIVEVDPPRRLVTRIADDDLPFGGSWTYELAAIPDGTEVTLTEDGEVYSPVFRFFSRFVFGHTATMERYLTAIHAHPALLQKP